MNVIDLIVFVWIAIAVFSGLKNGFIYKLGTLIGFVIGLRLAASWAPGMAEFAGGSPVATTLLFLLVLTLISKLFGILAWGMNKIFRFIAIIPFLKTFNRVLGGFLSLGIALLTMSAVFTIFDAIAQKDSTQKVIDESYMGQQLLKISFLNTIIFKDTVIADLNTIGVSSQKENDAEEAAEEAKKKQEADADEVEPVAEEEETESETNKK